MGCSRSQRFCNQFIEAGIPNDFDQRLADEVFPETEKLLKGLVDERDALIGIGYQQTILHGGKNCLRSRSPFCDLLIELLVPLEEIFKRERDTSRLGTAIDKKRARHAAPRDLLDDILDTSPRGNPITPGHISQSDGQSDNCREKKPRHWLLVFAQPVTKAANCFNCVAGFAEFFAKTPDMSIDGAGVDNTFVAPDVVEQSIARLDAATTLQECTQ